MEAHDRMASGKVIIFLLIALIVGFLAWASFTEIDEVTRGDGRVIPATRTQTIQATESGVVNEIAVSIGQIVRRGQLIIRLDDTTTQSDLGEVEARARALRARIARLEYDERGDFETKYMCPESVRATVPAICANEENLLQLGRQNYASTHSVLEQRFIQRNKELDEAKANIARLKGSLGISMKELELIEPLAKRRLVAQSELIRVQRDVNNAEGELSVLKETIPRLEGAIKEANFQMEEQALQFRQQALTQKTDALAELSVLDETARGESQRVERTDILSPVDGVINTMEINTIGSFVQPGTVVAEVVPTSEELLVEARISPSDVAFVVAGQKALVKITAFDFSIYGGLDGEVVNVSPDSIVDQQTGEPFFEVRVKTDTSQLVRGTETFEITPGMVTAVDILTGRKSILHYLLKPINKVKSEALSER